MDNSHSSTEPISTQAMEHPLLLNDSINTNTQFINQYQSIQSPQQMSTFNLKKDGSNPILSTPETNTTTIPAYSSVEVYPIQNELTSQYNHPILQLSNYVQSNHSNLINPKFNILTAKLEPEMLRESIQYQCHSIQNHISPTLQILETQLPRPIQSLTWPLPVYPILEYPEPSSIDPQKHSISNLPAQVFIPNNSLHLIPQNYQLELTSKSNFDLENQHKYQLGQLGQLVQNPSIINKTAPPLIKQNSLPNPQVIQQPNFINFTTTQPNKSQLSNLGPFKCTECLMIFNRKNSLRRHVKLHRGEKPFHCIPCNKKFSRLDIFKRHQSSKKCVNLTNQLIQQKNFEF